MIEKSFINNQLGIKFNSYIDNKCKVWFKAKQVAQILGYKDTDDAVRRHVSTENKMTQFINPKSCPGETPGQVKKSCLPDLGRQVQQGRCYTFINEPGFYELVFRSKLETAKKFRYWVFNKVLPSIRKYGYYKMIDYKIKQRVIFDGVKYYKHPVFSNYAANKNGNILSLKTKKILKMAKDSGGYFKFTICSKKLEKPINYSQHRFVFEVFKGPIPKCLEIDHINDIKKDNRIENLQLLTPRQYNEKGKNKPIISICIKNGKKEDLFLLKQLRLN